MKFLIIDERTGTYYTGMSGMRAAWDADACMWHARDGTHRFRAAMALGLAPVIVPVRRNRTRKARDRARHGANRNAHHFPHVEVRRAYA